MRGEMSNSRLIGKKNRGTKKQRRDKFVFVEAMQILSVYTGSARIKDYSAAAQSQCLESRGSSPHRHRDAIPADTSFSVDRNSSLTSGHVLSLSEQSEWGDIRRE